ncbi:hypothetical protein BDQ17DRAFT_1427655 [Cyathus striatus]|nr:hypothetical protein BDQ17DRAFT_1427655 [Cyathus striatus]
MANIQAVKYSYYLLDYLHAFREAYQKLGGLSGLRSHGILASNLNLTEVINMFRLANTVKKGLISPNQLLSMESFFMAATGAEIQASGVPSASIAQYEFALPRRSNVCHPGVINPQPPVRVIHNMSLPFGQLPVHGSGSRGQGTGTSHGGCNGHGSHSQHGGHRAQSTHSYSFNSDSVPLLVTINNN